MILRTIPLVFKKKGMKYVYNMAASANTATITNLEIFRLHRNMRSTWIISVLFCHVPKDRI